MKAIRVHKFGGPEVLKLDEVATPKPAAGEVLVRIHAAGVNPYDTYMRAGTYALHGASGGVGIAAVQISRAVGLRVLGTAGTPKGLELAKQEGAQQVFDHRKAGYQDEILRATENRGVDIILEMLANVNLSNDTKLLASNGRVVVIGSRGEVTINPRELMARRASIRAFTLWSITAAEEADIHAGLFAGLENGTLRPVVGKVLPLADAARAH
jgi:NADPH2:quinone reductase